MYSLQQEIVIFFLLAEVLVITLLVIATYLLKFSSVINKRRDNKKSADIDYYLHQTERNKKPPHLKRPDLILTALNESPVLGSEEKSRIVAAYLLSNLRPYINSRNRLKQYYLLEAYNYSIEKQDRQNLIRFIQSPSAILGINAIKLSHLVASEDIYQAIIDKLRLLDQFTQKIYIVQLQNHPLLQTVLKKNIEHTQDAILKITCYRIVEHIAPDPDFFDLALSELNQSDRGIKLAAIPVLAAADPKRAKDILIQLLKDKEWLIRNKSVKALGKIQQPNTSTAIAACLNDEARWVRVNAATALQNFGDEGHLLLTEYKVSEETLQSSVAAYFLGIQQAGTQ